MKLYDYFENTQGIGVLSTADKTGAVNAAIYARPHITEQGQAAFIMTENHSYSNIKQNPLACFLFKATGPGYEGKRLYLKRVSESDDAKLILGMMRKSTPVFRDDVQIKKHLVYFTIVKEQPLIGCGDTSGAECAVV